MIEDIDEGGASSHTSSHMSDRMTSRIEIVGWVSGRRCWTVEQKVAILRDAFGSEGSVRVACEQHESKRCFQATSVHGMSSPTCDAG